MMRNSRLRRTARRAKRSSVSVMDPRLFGGGGVLQVVVDREAAGTPDEEHDEEEQDEGGELEALVLREEPLLEVAEENGPEEDGDIGQDRRPGPGAESHHQPPADMGD